MDKSIDMFLACTRRRGYNCYNFAADVWLYLTGEDLRHAYSRTLLALKARKAVEDVEGFHRIQMPISPCVAILQRTRETPHIGIYYDGRILHLADRGAQFELPDVAMTGFKTLDYYR